MGKVIPFKRKDKTAKSNVKPKENLIKELEGNFVYLDLFGFEINPLYRMVCHQDDQISEGGSLISQFAFNSLKGVLEIIQNSPYQECYTIYTHALEVEPTIEIIVQGLNDPTISKTNKEINILKGILKKLET